MSVSPPCYLIGRSFSPLIKSSSNLWGIDALSGAMIQYEPSSYFVDLEREDEDISLKGSEGRRQIYFALTNFDSIRRDIAKGRGEYLLSYFSLLERGEAYDVFLVEIEENSSQILAQEDGVELYRHMATYLK